MTACNSSPSKVTILMTSGLSFRFLYAERKALACYRRNKIRLWVQLLSNCVYPPGRREHKAYEAKLIFMVTKGRGVRLKFILHRTIKLHPYFVPSKPDATHFLLSLSFSFPFFLFFPSSSLSGGKSRMSFPCQASPTHNNSAPSVFITVTFISGQTSTFALYSIESWDFMT